MQTCACADTDTVVKNLKIVNIYVSLQNMIHGYAHVNIHECVINSCVYLLNE